MLNILWILTCIQKTLLMLTQDTPPFLDSCESDPCLPWHALMARKAQENKAWSALERRFHPPIFEIGHWSIMISLTEWQWLLDKRAARPGRERCKIWWGTMLSFAGPYHQWSFFYRSFLRPQPYSRQEVSCQVDASMRTCDSHAPEIFAWLVWWLYEPGYQQALNLYTNEILSGCPFPKDQNMWGQIPACTWGSSPSK